MSLWSQMFWDPYSGQDCLFLWCSGWLRRKTFVRIPSWSCPKTWQIPGLFMLSHWIWILCFCHCDSGMMLVALRTVCRCRGKRDSVEKIIKPQIALSFYGISAWLEEQQCASLPLSHSFLHGPSSLYLFPLCRPWIYGGPSMDADGGGMKTADSSSVWDSNDLYTEGSL